MGFEFKIGSKTKLATAFTWCLLIAAACIPSTISAARFEVRNEIAKYPGRARHLVIKCWSTTNKLGSHLIRPGESKSWSFKAVYIKIPFIYTYFQCTFYTAFASPFGQNATVFAGERKFRWECDDQEEECIWVVKREGLYLRKITRDDKGQRLYEDELKLTWIGGTNYFPVNEDMKSYNTPNFQLLNSKHL
ncbi:S-protein [Hirschfeldia incana]|nr:S-protein [Hirschfeldia incana]